MKKFLPYIILVGMFFYLYLQNQNSVEYIYYIDGNSAKEPLPVEELKKDKYIFCSECDMMVKNIRYSGQVIVPSGRTYFFNDISCMIRWIDKQKYKDDELAIFVYIPECSCYMDAYEAWYVRDGLTPLGYGVVAFGTSMEAQRSDMLLNAEDYGEENFEQYSGNEKEIYGFDEVRKFVLRGETLLHPVARKMIFKGLKEED